MHKRKICTILVNRANYGRMWPVMRAMKDHTSLKLQTVCSGAMLLEKFGLAEKNVERDGFNIDGRVYLELEGSVPLTMAKSVGYGIIEFTNEFMRLQPDMVLLIGDRYEALAAAIAAAYMNIPIAHIQGGEVSGSIDESARHAITKLANYHFPATKRSADYIVRMGEDPAAVFNVGCPCGDYIRDLDTILPDDLFVKSGVGTDMSPDNRFLLIVFHPVSTEFGEEKEKITELFKALEKVAMPTIWLWPNIDAGSDNISKAIRIYREHHESDQWLRLIKNLEPIIFQKVLKKCICAIGNSSSFIRDASFSGTPVVLIGNRQEGREAGENVIAVPADSETIFTAIKKQIAHGIYEPSTLYGNGTASAAITEKLAEVPLVNQKKLHYIFR